MDIEQQLFDLWRVPPGVHPDPAAAFARLYADPVVINGAPMSVADLVARAEALHSAFTDHVIEIVDQVSAPGKLTIAFRHSARHTGPWHSPLGELPPTERTVSGLGIDVLSARRDAAAARRFFTRALGALKVIPTEVVTDAAPVYPGRGHYELGVEAIPAQRIAAAFTVLAQAI